MEQYPYFQKKIESRKQSIRRLEHLLKLSEDSGPKGVAKYKFEQKYIDKGIKAFTDQTIDITTNPDGDLYSKYAKLVSDYEADREVISKLQKALPKQDAITEADEQKIIADHFKEEELLERKLGSKYLAKAQKFSKNKRESITGSEIPAVSKRMAEDFIFDEFR